jgi:hypothetical protein
MRSHVSRAAFQSAMLLLGNNTSGLVSGHLAG